jgi:hypothetical protein
MTRSSLVYCAFAAFAVLPFPCAVKGQVDAFGQAEGLRREYPELHQLVLRLDEAHAVMLAEVARRSAAERSARRVSSRADFSADLLERLTRDVGAGLTDASPGGGLDVLGARGAEVVRWGRAFQREVLSALADPNVADARAALARVIERYRERPDLALVGAPKSMDVLYTHPYAQAFRTAYGDLDGLSWAGGWLRLAATEPLTDIVPGAARAAGVDTVSTRYFAKLTREALPQAFPTELPLAPAIAPGLIWLSPESAMIWDNLSLLLEVIADVAASPDNDDLPTAVDAAVDFFLDPETAVTDRDAWEIMALRHGIFFQGGFPLAVMTQSERNVMGHATHLAGGGMLMTMPGMPRR